VGIRRADHSTPSTCKGWMLTSPTNGGRSVGIVLLRTTAMEFSLMMTCIEQEIDSERLHSLHLINIKTCVLKAHSHQSQQITLRDYFRKDVKMSIF
jgi:hypothetical protein